MPFKKGITPVGAKPFEKGKSGNPKGKPKKLVKQLKEIGYTKSEVTETINVMLAMTIDQLKQIYENKESPILEKTIAAALKKSLRREKSIQRNIHRRRINTTFETRRNEGF